MSWFHRKAIAVVVTGLGLATILGATLGVAVAQHQTPVSGQCGNASGCLQYVGVIRAGAVSPDTFTKCIPAADWTAIYIWDGPNQQWQHYFNTAAGVPSSVNQSAAGGITSIPGFAGVVLIMKAGSPSQTVTLLDQNSESCN